jgi:hypothetical protein
MSCLRGQSNIMSGARVFGPQAWTGDAGDANHCVSLVDCLMEYCDQGRRKQTSSFSVLPWSPRARISIQGSSHHSGGREHSQSHGSDNAKARASPSTTDIGNVYNGTTDNCSLGGARLRIDVREFHVRAVVAIPGSHRHPRTTTTSTPLPTFILEPTPRPSQATTPTPTSCQPGMQ